MIQLQELGKIRWLRKSFGIIFWVLKSFKILSEFFWNSFGILSEFFRNSFRILSEFFRNSFEKIFFGICFSEFWTKICKDNSFQSVQHLLPLHHQKIMFRPKTWRLKMTKVSGTLVRHTPKKVCTYQSYISQELFCEIVKEIIASLTY